MEGRREGTAGSDHEQASRARPVDRRRSDSGYRDSDGAGSSEAAFPPGANGLIAFASQRDGGDYDVFVMGADGSAPVNLTSASAASDDQPAFSPDGTRIAFSSTRDGGDYDVFVMGADGSAPVNLTSASAAFDFDPAFSPDGTRIAFASDRSGGDFDVFAMGADGSAPVNLTAANTTNDSNSTFSPDGARIAFIRFDGGDNDVFAMGADGLAPTNLTSASAASDGQPAFSPDGTGIVFRTDRDGGDFDVFVMGPDGSSPTNLTSASAANDFNPDWQRLEPPPPVAGDTDPPETTIDKGPKKKTEKRKAKFEFSSDEPGSSFECKLDKKDFAPCDPSERFKVKPKKHKLQVRAVDAAGNVDPTPAKRRWKVKD